VLFRDGPTEISRVAWPGAKTAMQYQHPELEIVRAALDHDATGENKG